MRFVLAIFAFSSDIITLNKVSISLSSKILNLTKIARHDIIKISALIGPNNRNSSPYPIANGIKLEITRILYFIFNSNFLIKKTVKINCK